MDHQAFAQLLGSYGEFIGSLAILVTLAYLSIQVRLARMQTQVNDRQTREFAMRDFQLNLAASDGLAAALVRAKEAIGEETGKGFVQKLVDQGVAHEDAIRVFALYAGEFRNYANTYYTSRDEQQREANDWTIRFTYGKTKLGALFWEHYSKPAGTTLGPFGAHVQRLLESER